MRARNGLSLLRQHGSTLRSSLNCQQRLTSSRNYEPFVLPRLVIDLDAADSTLVKRWEDMNAEDNGGKDAQSSKGLRKKRDTRRDLNPRRYRDRDSKQQRFQNGSLMPCDVLSFAILGHPAAQQTSESRVLNSVYRRCGIQETDREEDVFQHLAATYASDITQRLTQVAVSQSLKEELGRKIETCKDFPKLKRTVTLLSSTTEGCRFLVQYEKSVLNGIRHCRSASKYENANKENPVSCSMVLQMLNNLKISMESKGVDIGPGLCNAGIYYASKVPNLPAVKEYLKTSIMKSHPANVHITLGLMQLQQLFQTGFESSQTSLLPHASSEADIFTLMNGFREDSGPWKMAERDVSFATLLYGGVRSSRDFHVNQKLYFTYIQGLGELGLSDALWEEFQAGKTRLPPSARPAKHKIYVARSFALACTVAGDSKRALSILQSAQPFPEPEASEEERTRLRQDHYKWLVSALDAHYRSRTLSPTTALRQEVEAEFHNLPGDPERTIQIFQQFVVRETKLHSKEVTVPAGSLVRCQNDKRMELLAR